MTTLQEFLSPFPPDVQKLALLARALIVEVFPGAVEQVDVPSRLVAYGTGLRMQDLVCTLIVSKSGVTLGLVRGSQLPDPEGLMGGKGKVHRSVKLRSQADLAQPALRALLQAAVDRKLAQEGK